MLSLSKQAKALGNARDRLTLRQTQGRQWGGYTGRHRYQADEGLMAGVSDVLKTAEYNQNSAIQAVQVSSHDNGKVQSLWY